jgi:putative ABC transport system substrate-binding protein
MGRSAQSALRADSKRGYRWPGLVRCIVLLALAVLLAPRTVATQQQGKVARVGYLATVVPKCSASVACQAMAQRLQELGYVEGQNLHIEFRTAEGQLERLPALAAELIQLPVDVLVAAGPEVTLRAARDATRTLPIVMFAVDYDPIALGYIAGLPRPGGNITGVFLRQTEVIGKDLELLKDALPQLTRVAVLWDVVHAADQFRAAEEAARVLGVQVHSLALSDPLAYDFEGAFAAAAREGTEALMVLQSPLFSAARARIVAMAAQHRLPAMYSSRVYVDAGGLMAYGASTVDMGRHATTYVDKILKGAKPADLPVEQPTKFELVINLKAAQALGLTLSPMFLFRADEVIK